MASFRRSIKRTYCKGVSKDLLYRHMLTVMQYKEQYIEFYYQKKTHLRIQCILEFVAANHAIIEGLTDINMANTLVASKYCYYEELWDIILEYQRIVGQRG
jgi:hypothetical protein